MDIILQIPRGAVDILLQIAACRVESACRGEAAIDRPGRVEAALIGRLIEGALILVAVLIIGPGGDFMLHAPKFVGANIVQCRAAIGA